MSQTTTTGFEVETAERTTSHQGLHKAIPRYQTVSEFLASCIPQQTDPANCLAAWKQHHPSCKLIFLVRHGETTSNILGYTQGPRVYSPLTLRGQRQVEEFGGFLRKHGKFDWYGSSSLTRAHLTARSLVEFECVYIEEALGEIYSSPLRGVPTCKDNEKIRQIDEWFSERHRQNPLATAYPDFTMADWVKAMGLLKEKMEAGEHRTFLLASHMVAIRWMVAMFLGIPTPPGKKLLGNMGVTCVRRREFSGLQVAGQTNGTRRIRQATACGVRENGGGVAKRVSRLHKPTFTGGRGSFCAGTRYFYRRARRESTI